jgi:FMN phosphatase YigB (HAD superfamily)
LQNYFSQSIRAIFFDMGGTLRTRVPDEAWQCQALARLWTMLDKPNATRDDLAELETRYKAYTHWAQAQLIELPETEIWAQWLVPDLPRERIAPRAQALTLAWRNRNGRALLKPDAASTLAEMHRRGYRLGLISNTISAADVPRVLAENHVRDFFEVVVLSSVCGIRKPDPEIFWRATRALDIAPAQCAYLGDRISRDVVGARRAGYGLAIQIKSFLTAQSDRASDVELPDVVIENLMQVVEVVGN